MKKSFQLSAVAMAIAASSSVMADSFTIVDTDDVGSGIVQNTYTVDTDALNSVTANTITANNQLIVDGVDVGTTVATHALNIAQNASDISTNAANIAQNTADISTNATNIATNTNAINQEIADRQANDQAIRNDIANNVTTNQLQVNGSGTVTGDLTVNGILKANINLSDVVTDTVVDSQKSNTANTIKYVGVTDENGSPVDVYEIAVDKNGTKAYIRADDNKEFKGDITQLDPSNLKPADFTGRSENTVGTKTTTDQVSQVTKSQVKYGESKTQQQSVEFEARLNDDLGNSEVNKVNGGFGDVTVLNDQSVELGIVGKDSDNNNIYGVVAKDIKDGIENTTTLTGQGLTTTGTVTADKMVVGGKDLGTELNRVETEAATDRAAIRDEFEEADAQLQSNIDAEAVTRADADNQLQANIDAEAATRADADNQLQANIDAEAATRADADNQLQANIDAEAATRADADNQLQANIDTEANTRANEDTAIRNDLATETTDRQNADVALQANIDSEAATRLAADNAATTDRAAIRTEFAAADATLQSNIDSEAATRLAADNAATTDRAAIRTEFAAADATLQSNIDSEAATRLAADNAATTDRAAIRTEFAAADATLQSNIDSEAATRLAADNAATTDRAKIRTEFAAADATLQSNIDSEAATRLAADNAATTDRAKIRTELAEGDAKTLASANAYTDTRANQLNRRIDDVQKTAYRGVAIALAAQQAVPNIQPGQVAVFGGVGHYEGETAVSLGVVTSFTDRISASGAFGVAGGNEFGGRVGVSYLFGGK